MPAKPIHDVKIVIVAYNSADVIEDLLTSIPKALGGLRAVVVVVDNGSTDRTVEVVESLGGSLVALSHNTGYAGGINLGAVVGPPAEAIVVLNPDVRLGPGSIESMFATLQSTRAGIVAPRVLAGDGALFRSLRREPTLLRAAGLGRTRLHWLDEHVSDPLAYQHRQTADWALGAALLIRTRVHQLLGGWDESFFLYSEETDFCLRAADRDWATVYDPDAVVTHLGGASGRSARTHSMQVVNRVRLYARRHTVAAGLAYLALTALGEASRVLRGRPESRVALRALLRPSARPAELGCSASLLPR